MSQLLLEWGADIYLKNKVSKTALELIRNSDLKSFLKSKSFLLYWCHLLYNNGTYVLACLPVVKVHGILVATYNFMCTHTHTHTHTQQSSQSIVSFDQGYQQMLLFLRNI